jgi:hypothetical protein
MEADAAVMPSDASFSLPPIVVVQEKCCDLTIPFG